MTSLAEESLLLKKTVILAIFSAAAVVLSVVEAMIPLGTLMVPGAKLGLANIMILTCLYFLDGKDTFLLVVLKTLLTAMILGTFSMLLFSLFGAMLSFVVMFGLMKISRRKLSLIGISVAGGIAHNIGQLAAAAIVIDSSSIFYYLPMLMIMGVATGVVVGIAVRYLINSLSNMKMFAPFAKEV
ncbi:Gx transporter family protein [Saccharibacillus sp. CPCC 101409]|uniref:Gx transporter family protein n=1 Tax=Saccharibacillus sp. CPCC 101409 TaxID=3058041 RepID=UPI0026733FC4|nr:Gx transporter family protein [Saccharibacillus sp. CPCC 101409]MDO3411428.1 Gx transporter family protein [Saccharibacillus sp. CPCC 101409]